MPIDIGESVNLIVDKLLSAPIVTGIMSSPVLTALFITVMIIIVILLVFYHTDIPVLPLAVRSGFWMFFIIVATLALHYRVLTRERNTLKTDPVYTGVFADGGLIADTIVPVNIPSRESFAQ
jgi:heme A synthase